MTEFVSIGSFTIFTNTNFLEGFDLDDSLLKAVSDTIVSYFKSRLEQIPGMEQVFVLSVDTKRGCIISTITLGAIVSAAGGIYVFVKDYDKLKTNLQSIIADFRNGYLKITKKKRDESAPPEITIYKYLPGPLKKYYASGQNIVIYSSDEEVITEITITSVMREDLTESFQESTIHSKIVTVKQDVVDAGNK